MSVPYEPQEPSLSDKLQRRFEQVMDRLTQTEPDGVPSDIVVTVEGLAETLINALDTFVDRMDIRSQKQRIFILQQEIDERNALIDNRAINIKKRDEIKQLKDVSYEKKAVSFEGPLGAGGGGRGGNYGPGQGITFHGGTTEQI